MDIKIYNFIKKNKIQKKYICKNHGGSDISPKIGWNIIKKAESYAIILEDPDALIGTVVHWYVPYINKNITTIYELNHYNLTKNNDFIQGNNTMGNIGYHGPCAPNNFDHNYIFYIYALDKKLKINNNKIMNIKDHYNFESILKDNNINILNRESKSFTYRHMNFYDPKISK